MSDDQVIILNRLLDKLSAVRATLKNDERVLLDSMVLGAEIAIASDEVTAHSLSAKNIEAAEAKLESAPDEVVAHAMEAKNIEAAEVEAGAVADAVASHYYKIELDEATESIYIFH
jgi:hypothetical protein